ncbi:MAG TPA: sulfite exporter TauE/SafE family protein [Candidatus Nanopelagicales bacterium]|nr:sulfite exporter TauE/SafE family protein [Candidatus Nanopelagicales bacterium]
MTDLATLSVAAWIVLAVAAFVIGFSKTAIGGLVLIAVALFAAVLPARWSTGVALLLLIVGDLFAIRAYTRYADWKVLRGLAPWVVVGIVAGAFFLRFAGDSAVKRTIGAILLVLVLVSIVRKLRSAHSEEQSPPSVPLEAGAGVGSGFMSMVANAGSLIYLYLLRLRLPMLTFLGTSAWYFFAVNLVKVPISLGLGLITSTTLLLTLVLSPAVAVGAIVGRYAVKKLTLAAFEWIVLVVTLVASLNLLR